MEDVMRINCIVVALATSLLSIASASASPQCKYPFDATNPETCFHELRLWFASEMAKCLISRPYLVAICVSKLDYQLERRLAECRTGGCASGYCTASGLCCESLNSQACGRECMGPCQRCRNHRLTTP